MNTTLLSDMRFSESLIILKPWFSIDHENKTLLQKRILPENVDDIKRSLDYLRGKEYSSSITKAGERRLSQS